MAQHDHILNRIFQRTHQQESCKQKSEKSQIKSALIEIKSNLEGLPVQTTSDIASALMDIEAALEAPNEP